MTSSGRSCSSNPVSTLHSHTQMLRVSVVNKVCLAARAISDTNAHSPHVQNVYYVLNYLQSGLQKCDVYMYIGVFLSALKLFKVTETDIK